ncbi:MAG: hypothetical protein AAFR71_16800 [Pseudomonadota bacterium]
MTDNEAMAKGVTAIAIIIGVIAIGYVALIIVLPLTIVGLIIDCWMRKKYNRALRDYEKDQETAIAKPAISMFDAKMVDGEVLIGWLVDLPDGTSLDIYRSENGPGGAFDDVAEYAQCIHSTRRDYTADKDDLFVDHSAPDGVVYYVPVIAGTHIERTPIDYSLFDFSRKLQFTERKRKFNARGDAVRVEVTREFMPLEVEDMRDDTAKMTDDILSAIADRKSRERSLDEAITRIKNADDLSEAEKAEAIELLETRMGAA